MFDVRADLVVPLDGIDPESLLEHWRWLLPESLRPWFATALGVGLVDSVGWPEGFGCSFGTPPLGVGLGGRAGGPPVWDFLFFPGE